jgi:hypothetical protein
LAIHVFRQAGFVKFFFAGGFHFSATLSAPAAKVLIDKTGTNIVRINAGTGAPGTLTWP